MKKGEVTAFLSLIFILLLSFLGAMVESASIQVVKNYRRADMNRAIESVFAEYQKELLEEYDVFALEVTYETGEYSEDQIKNRLTFYGAGQLEHQFLRLQLLSDHQGLPFYEQTVAYMKNKMGADSLQELLGISETWVRQEEEAEEYLEQEGDTGEELDSLLQEYETELPMENNPLQNIDQVKQSGLLQLLFPRDKELSNKVVQAAQLPSNRTLHKGYGSFSYRSGLDSTLSKLFFGEYALEKFGNAVKPQNENSLAYETEYIIAGKESDRENLETVAKRLLLLRFASNYAYLLSDTTKLAEAEAMALALSSVVALPVLTAVVKQALLLAWAYGESVMDLRALLSEKKVPLIKSAQSWQLQLTNLLTLGTEEDTGETMDEGDGMEYKEYLRILLFLTDRETCTMRSLDLIEQNLRVRIGLQFFRTDQCVSKVELRSTCSLRRGIQYDFPTYFAYH